MYHNSVSGGNFPVSGGLGFVGQCIQVLLALDLVLFVGICLGILVACCIVKLIIKVREDK